MRDTHITISIASIPSREAGLLETVRRLLPQCDTMNICLNDYPFIPRGLTNPKIEVLQACGDDALSDRGKFYWCKTMLGYHLTADDDIIYPYDYVETMIAKIEQYKRQAIISYHGSRFLTAYGKLINYPTSRQLVRFGDTTDGDMLVHMVGTGVGGYHTSLIQFDHTSMPLPGADEHLAIYAQLHKIPMIVPIHYTGWLMDNKASSTTQAIHQQWRLQQKMINMLCSYKRWCFYGEELLNENSSVHMR